MCVCVCVCVRARAGTNYQSTFVGNSTFRTPAGAVSVGARTVVCRIYVCPHITIYVSSYYLLHIYITICVCDAPNVSVSSLSVGARTVVCRIYVCPHTTICVSSNYYICVLILLYMCPHTTIYVCEAPTVYVSSLSLGARTGVPQW